MASWLSGTGAAAIDDLMEDAATAEISRAQVWQWVHHSDPADPGRHRRDPGACPRAGGQDARTSWARPAYDPELLVKARDVFELVALADDFPAFLTLPAYELT